jgi:hypothetical protein
VILGGMTGAAATADHCYIGIRANHRDLVIAFVI